MRYVKEDVTTDVETIQELKGVTTGDVFFTVTYDNDGTFRVKLATQDFNEDTDYFYVWRETAQELADLFTRIANADNTAGYC